MHAVSPRSVLVLGARGRLGLAALIGPERGTPLSRAVCTALQGLGLVGATGCGLHAWA